MRLTSSGEARCTTTACTRVLVAMQQAQAVVWPACRVAVLEGGLPDWKAASLPLDTAAADEAAVKLTQTAAQAAPAASKYKATLDASKVRQASKCMSMLMLPLPLLWTCAAPPLFPLSPRSVNRTDLRGYHLGHKIPVVGQNARALL